MDVREEQEPRVAVTTTSDAADAKRLAQTLVEERLAACVEFLVFGRGETPEPREGYVMHPLSAPHPASSTEIRTAFAAGERTHPWVDPLVAGWIVEKRLYQD